MSMGFSFGQSPSQRPSQAQKVDQRLEQKLGQRQSLGDLAIRVEILQALHPGGPSTPEGVCPACRHELSVEEILRGFRDDINDTTTACPQCGTRFQPMLVARNTAGYAAIHFLCERQTLARLPELASTSFDEIQRNHQQVLASARFYFGTLTKGMSLVGITYQGEPSLTWKDRVRPFLGRCPDSLIAELCNVSASTVRRFRVSLGVETFQRTQATNVLVN